MTDNINAADLSDATSTTVSDDTVANQTASNHEKNNERKLIVTAELDPVNQLELASSVSIIDAKTIEQRNAQHFSELLNLAPNVNFSTGASRGRFVQIRGIGERSEFIEPVNYSVGVIVDGIDLTGISTAATLLDVQQVEILRGPQGTLYGANALAGLINVVSNQPTDSYYSKLSMSVEEFGGRSLSAVVSNSITENFGYRVSIGQAQNDGYMQNVFLNRDDTNNIDETSMRAHFVYQASQDLSISTSLLFADIDNGYDAFSLDSNRSTYSDEPGHDRQKTTAAAFKFDWQLDQELQLLTSVSFADSDLEYGYDEDWSHIGICNNTACDTSLWGFDWWYSSFDNYTRENNNNSFDVRLHSKNEQSKNSWTLGVYYRDQQVDLLRQYTFLANDFSSHFDTLNTALYGQVVTGLSDKLSLTAGLRLENRSAEYSDINNSTFNPDEDLWGGKISLEYDYAAGKMLYGLISRGYKAGGFNTDGSVPVENREYDTEFMWNYEAGIKGKWLENTLTMQAAIFYQDRDEVQIKQSIVRSISDGLLIQEGGASPYSFTDFIDNAAQGVNYGLEFEMQWQANDNLDLYSTLGLLKTEFKKFISFNHIDADLNADPPIAFDLSGRQQAHAPSYQMVLGSNYFVTENWRFNLEVEAKDEFLFSNSHEEKSDAYEIVNLGLAYLQETWQLNFYIHNLTNQDVKTRGFGSFGNDPRKFYETEAYYQFAAPRVIGVAFNVEFE